ncbi:MAG: hypothetical protein IH948_00055 [Bacteroidetes bacterium]|nr:hypothetical protein [Bacteroidota bacterium]
MTKLKTLKDLTGNDLLDTLVEAFALKKEAIKWVKNCEVKSPVLNYEYKCTIASIEYKCHACRRMIAFFNITEEDLK